MWWIATVKPSPLIPFKQQKKEKKGWVIPGQAMITSNQLFVHAFSISNILPSMHCWSYHVTELGKVARWTGGGSVAADMEIGTDVQGYCKS
jgi:hypothetical protein